MAHLSTSRHQGGWARFVLALATYITGAASMLVRPQPAASVVQIANCSSIPINLATKGNWFIFREIDEMLELTFRQLGHNVNMLNAPMCNLTLDNLDAPCDAPSIPSGTGALTVVTTLCASWEWYGHRLPRETIVMQLEPLAIVGAICCEPSHRAQGLEGRVVWEYSFYNVRSYHSTYCKLESSLVEIIPLRAYPGLRESRDPPAFHPPEPPPSIGYREEATATGPVQVLFMGTWYDTPGNRRYELIHELARRGVLVTVLTHSWGKAERESYIARAKIVLNVHKQPEEVQHMGTFPLEVVRMQYLLANGAFVISESSDETDMRPYVEAGGAIFAPYEQLVDTVVHWLQRPAEDRAAVARAGYQLMHSKSMTQVLQGAVQRAIRHLMGVQCAY